MTNIKNSVVFYSSFNFLFFQHFFQYYDRNFTGGLSGFEISKQQKRQIIEQILTKLNLGTAENMVFGRPAGNELEKPRQNVRGVIFDPESKCFCLVKMDNLPFWAGGGTDGEDLETALRREIEEELGYTDFEIKDQLGLPIISYLSSDKATHRYLSDTGFLVVLGSMERKEINLSEEEKGNNLREVWLTAKEFLEIYQNHFDGQNPDLGYARHLAIFGRALEKLG